MLGKRVKQLRIERGLTLSELAEAAGVAKSYLSTIERNIHTNPSIHILEKIAAVLDIPVEQLLVPEESDIRQKEAWYALFREAVRFGISRDELRALIEFKKWEGSRKTKGES